MPQVHTQLDWHHDLLLRELVVHLFQTQKVDFYYVFGKHRKSDEIKKGHSVIFRPPPPPPLQTTADLSSPTLTAGATE
jgi:hypothetical protein